MMFSRVNYSVGDRVVTSRGVAKIVNVYPKRHDDAERQYSLDYDDGRLVTLGESELKPLSPAAAAKPSLFAPPPSPGPDEKALKYDEGKAPLSMVSRELMEAMARVRHFGAQKYKRGNWRRGFLFTRSIDAALRHIAAFNSGEDMDPESKESHIAHAMCCLEHLLHDYIYRKEQNDDREKAE